MILEEALKKYEDKYPNGKFFRDPVKQRASFEVRINKFDYYAGPYMVYFIQTLQRGIEFNISADDFEVFEERLNKEYELFKEDLKKGIEINDPIGK